MKDRVFVLSCVVALIATACAQMGLEGVPSIPTLAPTLPSVGEAPTGTPPPTATQTATPSQTATETATPSPTADAQATEDAAGAATSQARADMDATVEAAVTATVEAEMMLNPVPESEVGQSEEVESAVIDLAALATEIDGALATAVLDDVLSSGEVEELEALVADALVALDYAVYLAETYEEFFAYLSSGSIDELYALFEDLEEIEALLFDAVALLESGGASPQEGLAELEALVSQLNALADSAALETGLWQDEVRALVEQRIAETTGVQPNLSAENRAAAIKLAMDFTEDLRAAAADQVFTQEEMRGIAQSAANATVALDQQGGPLLKDLARIIEQASASSAAGQFGELQGFMSDLDSLIPDNLDQLQLP